MSLFRWQICRKVPSRLCSDADISRRPTFIVSFQLAVFLWWLICKSHICRTPLECFTGEGTLVRNSSEPSIPKLVVEGKGVATLYILYTRVCVCVSRKHPFVRQCREYVAFLSVARAVFLMKRPLPSVTTRVRQNWNCSLFLISSCLCIMQKRRAVPTD